MSSRTLVAIVVLVFAPVVALHCAEPDPTVTSHIPRERVQATGLASVGYSKRRQILEIEFVNGAVYRYFGVPISVYHALMSAESKTGYYVNNIKRYYRFEHVRPRVKKDPTD